VTLDNSITYEADGYILTVDPPRMNTTVDREQYKITMADPEFVLAADADNGMVGKLVEVRLCFVDPDTGLPLTALEDSLVVYKGKLDGVSLSVDTADIGESVIEYSCASPLVSLEQKNGYYMSREFMRGINPTDSCCDAIYEGAGSLTFKWGRI
jgi:hypothetical protein